MKVNYILLISLLIVGALFVPSVSGELLTDNVDNSLDWSIAGSGYTISPCAIRIFEASDWIGLNFVYFNGLPSTGDNAKIIAEPYWHQPVNIGYGESIVGSGTAYYNGLFRADGSVSGIQFWIDIDTIDMKDMSGNTLLTIVATDNRPLWNGVRQNGASSTTWQDTRPIHFSDGAGHLMTGIHIARSDYYWQNNVTVDNNIIAVNRVFDDSVYFSNVTVITPAGTTIDLSNRDINVPYTTNAEWIITNAKGTVFSGNTTLAGNPNNPAYPVTVYAQNANTGALIADTNLSVNLYETETWYNTTLEWGWDTIQLPAGNYEFYAEKSGYTQYAPSRLTVDGIGDDIGMYLYPNVETPPAGNITLDFWICDTNNNGIPYAELSVMGLAGEGADYNSGILETNQLGYVSLTVLGNSTYLAYASKPGYTPGENEFGVTTYTPLHVAIRLLGGEIPTNPTATPTGVTPTVTPTVRPTDVAPGNNPIDNFRVMFLNMGFDDNYTDWLTGLFIICIGAALGYCLVKKVGAMCGAPIGLLTAVGLGLIPIWALVLIIVIVALAYAKFFMGR